MRIYYLFPLVVFIMVIGALYKENKTEKEMKKLQNKAIKIEQIGLPVQKTSSNFK